MQCPQQGQTESTFTGFGSDVRKYIMAQESLRHVNYSVNVFASYTETNLRVRNGECIGWAPFYQTSKRDSCGLDCPAIPTSWRDSTTGKLLPFQNLTVLAGGNANLQRYQCCIDFAAANMLDFSDTLLYRYTHSGGMLQAAVTMLSRAEFFNLMALVMLVR